MRLLVLSLLTLVFLGAGCAKQGAPTTASTPSPNSSSTVMSTPLQFPGILPAESLPKRVRVKTTMGDMVIELNPAAGPRAASNFAYLVRNNFYNGTIFHRVIPGFMIQGGDPTGTGTGDPGYRFAEDPVTSLETQEVMSRGQKVTLAKYTKGTVAMAKTAMPNSSGSQFFIMVDDVPLSPEYSVFGRVIEGQDVADAIAEVSRDEMDRPYTEIKMTEVIAE